MKKKSTICLKIFNFCEFKLSLITFDSSLLTFEHAHKVTKLIRKIHPSAKILVIDAAVGKSEDIGTIKISNTSIKPGLGVNKNLAPLGNYCIGYIVY